jgi:formate dehydrogenase major subunit/formate dehydrogenase alpha subunit
MTNSIAEIENTDFMFVIGSNTTEAHPVIALRMKKAARRGATIVVADPRKIWLTKLAKYHLQLQPGTDVWLINALMNVIVTEDLVNHDYIREHAEDYEAVKEVVLRYPPEEAAKITGVPADLIRKTAREYATTDKAAVYYTLGITEHTTGVDNVLSLCNMVVMTGHLGRESVGMNPLRGQNNVQGANDMGNNPIYHAGYQKVDDPEVRKKFSEAWGVTVPETPGYRLDQMMSGMHDGRVKGFYIMGEDPILSEPDANHVEKGFAGLEFVACQDIFLSETARKYAHVVLPAACFAEKDGTFTNTERRVQMCRKAVEPPGQAKSDWEILQDVAQRLGANWNYSKPEQIWDEMADLSPRFAGIRYDRIQEEGIQWPCWDREHAGEKFMHAGKPFRGKARMFPIEYRPPHETADAEYDLTMSTGRTLFHYNAATQTRRVSGLASKQGSAFIEVNPSDAAIRGIEPDEKIVIRSRRGAIQARAELTTAVPPGVVWMPMHYAEARANELTHDVGDPEIGTPEYKVTAVRLEKLAG